MAVHMMEILKQIQRELAEQKEYIQNIDGVPNINLTVIEQIRELHNKIDQQQATIKRLEHQIKKNNVLLFGSEDSETIVEDRTAVPHKQNKNNKLDVIQVENGNKHILYQEKDPIKKSKDLQAAIDENKIGESTNNETAVMIKVMDEAKKTSRSTSIEKAYPVRKLQAVQISPTFFSADQLSKLNTELKRITENYKVTNIFPDIQVVSNTSPVDDHPVMKKLCQGVVYSAFSGYGVHPNSRYAIKIGTSGFERQQVQDLLAEYPDFSLYDVVREGLKSTNEWCELFKMYNFCKPINFEYPD